MPGPVDLACGLDFETAQGEQRGSAVEGRVGQHKMLHWHTGRSKGQAGLATNTYFTHLGRAVVFLGSFRRHWQGSRECVLKQLF